MEAEVTQDIKKLSRNEKLNMNDLEQQRVLIPTDQVLQAQFAKVGQLIFQIDIMRQQLQAFETENKALRDELNKLKVGQLDE